MKTNFKILLFSLCICSANLIFAQRSTEAKNLLDSINKNIRVKANPRKIIELSEELLMLAKKEKDTFLILKSIHSIARRSQFTNDYYKSLKYFKRELSFFENNLVSKKVKKEIGGSEVTPVEIYAQIGNCFASLGDNKTALNYFDKSKEIAEKEDLEFYKAVLPVLIGQVKASIKDYSEAISYFKLGLERLEKSQKINEGNKIFNSSLTVSSLAQTFLLNKQIDSAKTILNLGILKGYDKYANSTDLNFRLVEAAILVEENQLDDALIKYNDLQQKANSYDSISGIIFYYNGYAKYLSKVGKYHEAALLMEKGINERKKETKEFSLADDYKQLAKYYKKAGNTEKSNEYYEKYVLSQTAIEKNKRDVLEIFYDKEIKNINFQKEEQLKATRYYIIGSSVLILLLVLFLYNTYKNKKKESLQFNELLSKLNSQPSLKKQFIDTKEEIILEKNTTINTEIKEQILSGLQKLESQEYYLKQECNLYNVAKKIKTNTTYLSKVINAEFEKNFNTYINDLRINYTIIKLKNDARFRSYSVKSIANEVGYKSTDSFSKYFKFRTGLLPSIYIKKLNTLA